ncbi:uncharacterized protein ARMOST_20118 [Armillaria ostoyae]|uniref:Uncharacterized protein n=1 Tax=Armillaria ostoyae TaxID=47428 RepID=A0A284S6F3_ARMOS|nr:uncharacterized protein ARMOST_20118 [Armillaria ostoyae]
MRILIEAPMRLTCATPLCDAFGDPILMDNLLSQCDHIFCATFGLNDITFTSSYHATIAVSFGSWVPPICGSVEYGSSLALSSHHLIPSTVLDEKVYTIK